MRKLSPWELWTLQTQLVMSLMTEVAPAVRKLKLEMKEFYILAAVDEHPNPADVARELMFPKPSVTFMVKRLESIGYLRREVQADDLRRFRLSLTAAGRRAMEAARATLEVAFSKRLARLTQPQRAELARLLERMACAE